MNELLTAPLNDSIKRPIDWLFEQLAARYGRHWFDLWSDVPMADVKNAWQEELTGFTMAQAKAALAKSGKFPPTLPEFVALCKPDPIPAAQREFARLPAAKGAAHPAVQAEIDRFLKTNRKRDPKDWARKILAEAEAGTYRIPIGIEFAKEALGLK